MNYSDNEQQYDQILTKIENVLIKITENLKKNDDRISVEEFVIRGIMSAMLRDDLEFSIELLKSYRETKPS